MPTCLETLSPLIGSIVCSQGADDVFNFATGKESGQQSGIFYVNGQVANQPAVAQDKKMLQQLWKIMEQQTGAQFSC